MDSRQKERAQGESAEMMERIGDRGTALATETDKRRVRGRKTDRQEETEQQSRETCGRE
jgi:hypothetical protein